MYRALFMSSLLVALAASGCFGGDDAAGPSNTTSTTGAPDPDQAYRVVVRNYTANVMTGDPINVTWEVRPAVEDNSTNGSVIVAHTALHWGNQSIARPSSAQEPSGTLTPSPTLTTSPTVTDTTGPETSHATVTTTTSTMTSTATSGPTTSTTQSTSGPSDYPNETAEQTGVAPSVYRASLTVNRTGLVYVRAHAILDNRSYWSDEVVVNVTNNASVALGTTHIITIGGTPGGPLSQFTPKAATIKVGDAIVWKNQDTAAVSNQHSAESTQGPKSFNTGTIGTGSSSKPVYFNQTGSWTYRCGLHPNTMAGNTITVA